MKNALSLLALLFLLVTPGCGPIKLADYSGFVNIGSAGMPTGQDYSFSPLRDDSTLIVPGKYDVIIAVRFRGDCPSGSVIFNIEEISLIHEKPDSTVVEIPLFDDKGAPLGNNYYGMYEVTDTIRYAYPLPEGYTLSISSPLPRSATSGIRSVGLILTDPARPKQIFRWKI